MKKTIPAVIVLVALAAVAFVFFKKAVVAPHVPAFDLVPAETIFFAQLPDWRRTSDRWSKTALAQIGEEPEVKAFLAKPRANAPQMKLWDQKLAQLKAVEAGEAFVAVTSIEGNEPRFLAGFSFAGRKADVEALLAEPRAEMKSNWPAGKSDVTLQGKTQIETFTHQDTTIGEAFYNDWYFVSNDMELLRHTIDTAAQGLGAKGLGASDLFRKSTARLPADGELVVFAQMGTLTDRLVSLLVASGQTLDPKQKADLKKIEAVAWGTKFEGALMRDTLFILSPGNAVEPLLAQNALAFSNADSFLTYSAALPATNGLGESASALGAFLPSFAAFQNALAAKGLKLDDFGRAFGPEFGVVLSWPHDTVQPSALVALDVRDPAMARTFAEVYADGAGGGPHWGREDRDGVTIFQEPAAAGASFPVMPAVTYALTDHFLAIGFSEQDVLAGIGRLKNAGGTLSSVPAFTQASGTVGKPTSGFGYLDLKTLVERSYGTLRPIVAMSIALSPDSAKYVDAGKLPSADAISKHLSPTVYSQSVSADGTLIESVGPLTFNQVAGVSLGGAIFAALPMIESAFSGGMKLDPSLLQMLPQKSVPTANATPNATPQPVPAEPAPPAEKPSAPAQ